MNFNFSNQSKNHRMSSPFRQSRGLYTVWISTLLAVFIAPVAYAQNAQRSVQDVVQKDSILELRLNDGVVQFRPYAANLIETSFRPQGAAEPQPSHAVVMKPLQLPVRLRQDKEQIEFRAGDMLLKISKSPYQVSYFYKDRPLLSEQQGFHKAGAAQAVDFNISQDEVLYGAGARALGMNRRGHRLPLYNKAHYGYEERSEQMNFSMPLVYSSKLYGIHFDNASTGFLDLDSQKNNRLAFEANGGRQTYQIFAADQWEHLVATYTTLTGKQPLPARWVLGNFASRFGYHTEQEARTIVQKYKAEAIPLDAIIFDLFWFGKEVKGTMGNLAFDRDSFPQPEKMMADFAKQGVKTILITEPFILTTSKRWKEATEQRILATDAQGKAATYDFYFGHTGLIDVFDPVAKDWFWNIYAGLKKQGVSGWWGDLGEPEVHPSHVQHKTGSADQVHNIYGHEWAKLIAQGYQKHYPNERPFILMRAGYSGSQHHGMIPWSGDVNRTWGGLRSQPEIALQMGMQGMAYMHSDLGGFAGANLDDELYARWLQYGVFQPVFRPHAQEEVASEPVLRSAHAKALAKAAIELRYQLLPYNYTLSFLNHQRGLPLMRPLFFAEPANPGLQADASSYFWGNDFLVHPVLQAGQKQAEIYFPKNGPWLDFYTGQRYAAGSRAAVPLQADRIPVFVRAGAWIPQVQGLQNTAQFDVSKLDLHYYYDEEQTQSDGMLYDDDGLTANAYESRAYAIMRFRAQKQQALPTRQKQLTLSFDHEYGKQYIAKDRNWRLVVHQIKQRPQSVKLNQQDSAFTWDAQKQELTVDLAWKARQQLRMQVLWAEAEK